MLPRDQATKALKIYKDFAGQAKKAVEFFEMGRRRKFEIHLDIPEFKHPPLELAVTLEDYLKAPDFEQQRLAYKNKKKGSSNTYFKNEPVSKKEPEKEKPLIDFFDAFDDKLANYESKQPTVNTNFDSYWDNGGNDQSPMSEAVNPFVNAQLLQQQQMIEQQMAQVNNMLQPINPFGNQSNGFTGASQPLNGQIKNTNIQFNGMNPPMNSQFTGMSQPMNVQMTGMTINSQFTGVSQPNGQFTGVAQSMNSPFTGMSQPLNGVSQPLDTQFTGMSQPLNTQFTGMSQTSHNPFAGSAGLNGPLNGQLTTIQFPGNLPLSNQFTGASTMSSTMQPKQQFAPRGASSPYNPFANQNTSNNPVNPFGNQPMSPNKTGFAPTIPTTNAFGLSNMSTGFSTTTTLPLNRNSTQPRPLQPFNPFIANGPNANKNQGSVVGSDSFSDLAVARHNTVTASSAHNPFL